MTDEKLQEIVEHIESIKFLLDERNLDSQALQVELAGLPPTKNLKLKTKNSLSLHPGWLASRQAKLQAAFMLA